MPETDTSMLDQFSDFLREAGLPLSLLDFIKNALVEGKTQVQITEELRHTPEYKLAYPENDLRERNGFSFMNESEIRNYRDEARRLSTRYLGYSPTNDEIANAVGNNKSVAELERDFQVQTEVAKYGETVKNLFYQELGYSPSEDRLFAFMHPEIPTPELDRAFENALYRGRPEMLGLGLRPEQEAETLRQYGIDVNQAFRGYQGIAGELPRTERLAAISQAIQRQVNIPGVSEGIKNATTDQLFRAIQLQNPEAIRQLKRLMDQERARFLGGGGAATQGTRAVGLMTKAQRESAGA